jgi:O-antigen ligase
LLLCGSKPLAYWFEWRVASAEEGSSLDRLALLTLLAITLWILKQRRIDWSEIMRDNFWIVLLYVYLAFSILWSDFPFVSFRRWVRLSAAIPIALIVLTEHSPLKALESVFRRTAYILIPFSLLLVKYYPELGVEYVSWSGRKSWVGVASQKNGLGIVCAVSAFFIVWALHQQWRTGGLAKAKAGLLADLLVFGIALYLLRGFAGAYSATSVAVFAAGIALLFLLYITKDFARNIAVFLLVAVGIVLLTLPFAGSMAELVTSLFGRNESFTGRTDIWLAVLGVASNNPVLGLGYGGFWGLQDKVIKFATLGVNEGHNGYIDVYLDVGILGITLLFTFLIAYYNRVLKELNRVHHWAVFGICILIMSLMYNFTESSFLKTSSYLWNIMVFLTVVFGIPQFDKRGNKS